MVLFPSWSANCTRHSAALVMPYSMGKSTSPPHWKIIGFRKVICMPGDVKLGEQNVTLVVHVDDIVTVVAEDSLKMKRERLE